MSATSLDRVRMDFDRIAGLLSRRSEPAEFYEEYLLLKIPRDARVLDVGSGAGRMARLLAGRARSVVGIDASAQMVELARLRSEGHVNVTFVCADFMSHAFGDTRFDCVFSAATLHHLPLSPAIERMKSLLAPGGLLVIHDVRAPSGVVDWLSSGVRATAKGEIAGWLRRRLGERGELARAWHDHGSGDHYLTMADVRALSARHLPGALIHSHPLWRYSTVWRNSPP